MIQSIKMDTIRIEQDSSTKWMRVYVNDKLQVSTDHVNLVVKFVEQLLKFDAAISDRN